MKKIFLQPHDISYAAQLAAMLAVLQPHLLSKHWH